MLTCQMGHMLCNEGQLGLEMHPSGEEHQGLENSNLCERSGHGKSNQRPG